MLEAQVGDPVVVRTLVAGTNDVHTWHLDGHWFRIEPYSRTSPPVNTVHLGISERFDLVIPRAGGPQGRAGDYLYHSGRIFKLREGSWGLLRSARPAPQALCGPCPRREATPPPAGGLCPQKLPEGVRRRGSPSRSHAGRLPRASLRPGGGPGCRPRGRSAPEPLVLHVNVGDCLEVWLRNETDAPVSLHADLLAYDPAEAPSPCRLRSGGTRSSPTPRWARRQRCCGTLGTCWRTLDWGSMGRSSWGPWHPLLPSRYGEDHGGGQAGP